MANKRKLKKNINCICGDLFSECIAAALYGNKKQEDVNALLGSILIVNNEFLNRVSHPEPGMKPKLYYKDLKTQFGAQITELVDNIANL